MEIKRDKCAAVVYDRELHAEVHADVPMPAMDETGALTKTIFSTISRGTELDLYTGQLHDPGQTFPMLPGYIAVGEVLEVGDEVDHLKVGDHVVSSNLFGDWAGDYCVAWAGHLEYLVYSKVSHKGLSSKRAVKIPEDVPLEQAGIALLGAVAYHGVEYKIDPQPGETVLVVGQGVIGSMAAQECKAKGARVIVADICQNRLDVAEAWGADGTINAAETDMWGELSGMVKGSEPQAIIEVTGEPKILEDVLAHAPQHCRIQAQGMYLEPIELYIPRTLFGRHLTLSSTCGEKPHMVASVLDLMADGKVDVSGLVSEIMPATEATEAYRRIYEQPDEVVTIALDWRDF